MIKKTHNKELIITHTHKNKDNKIKKITDELYSLFYIGFE